MDRTGADGEEEEEEDDVDQSEVQRRKERLEREQWLREQVGRRVFTFIFASLKSPTQRWEMRSHSKMKHLQY